MKYLLILLLFVCIAKSENQCRQHQADCDGCKAPECLTNVVIYGIVCECPCKTHRIYDKDGTFVCLKGGFACNSTNRKYCCDEGYHMNMTTRQCEINLQTQCLQCTNGTNGIDGTNGINGTNGVNGTDGVDGINGQNGTDGLNGTSYILHAVTTYNDDPTLVGTGLFLIPLTGTILEDFNFGGEYDGTSVTNLDTFNKTYEINIQITLDPSPQPPNTIGIYIDANPIPIAALYDIPPGSSFLSWIQHLAPNESLFIRASNLGTPFDPVLDIIHTTFTFKVIS